MMKILCILGLWMAFSLSILQAKEIKMSSPDGKYQVTLSDEGGNLHYSVNSSVIFKYCPPGNR